MCIADNVLLYSLCSPAEEYFYRRLPRAHLGQIQFCQFLRETRYLISYGNRWCSVLFWDLVQGKAVAYAWLAEREERVTSMCVSTMEDEVVCLTSTGRVITIKLHGLKSATMPSQNVVIGCDRKLVDICSWSFGIRHGKFGVGKWTKLTLISCLKKWIV